MGTEARIKKHRRLIRQGFAGIAALDAAANFSDRNERRLRLPTERPTQTPDQLARIVAEADVSKARHWPGRHTPRPESVALFLSEREAL